MQSASDIMLGWLHTEQGFDGRPRDFYGRQLWDWKFSADVDTMNPRIMGPYVEMCAWTLARAHARSGDRLAIASYLGQSDVFDRAIADFAEAYADQSERDYEALLGRDRERAHRRRDGDLALTFAPRCSASASLQLRQPVAQLPVHRLDTHDRRAGSLHWRARPQRPGLRPAETAV